MTSPPNSSLTTHPQPHRTPAAARTTRTSIRTRHRYALLNGTVPSTVQLSKVFHRATSLAPPPPRADITTPHPRPLERVVEHAPDYPASGHRVQKDRHRHRVGSLACLHLSRHEPLECIRAVYVGRAGQAVRRRVQEGGSHARARVLLERRVRGPVQKQESVLLARELALARRRQIIRAYRSPFLPVVPRKGSVQLEPRPSPLAPRPFLHRNSKLTFITPYLAPLNGNQGPSDSEGAVVKSALRNAGTSKTQQTASAQSLVT